MKICHMPTVLFCLFTNDLGYFMQANGCLQIDFDIQHDQILTYLETLILLHADEAAIFATDPITFQHNLNVFLKYSKL